MVLTHMICQMKIQNIPGFIFLTIHLEVSAILVFHIYTTGTI